MSILSDYLCLDDCFVIIILGKPNSGKTTLLRAAISELFFRKGAMPIYFMGRDYQNTYNYNDISKHRDLDDELVSKLSDPSNEKIFIMDDFLSIEFTKPKMSIIKGIMAESRHINCHVFVSTQSLKATPKPIRICAQIFITHSTDPDAREMMRYNCGLSLQEVNSIKLKEFQFAICMQGAPIKIIRLSRK